MKKILYFFLLTFRIGNLHSQCTGCTVTISGTDNNPYIVNSGMTLCITSTGTLTGDMLISGGTVCNGGHINNVRLYMQSGSLTNLGTLHADSFVVNDSQFDNSGDVTGVVIAVTNLGVINNSATMRCNFFGDSAAGVLNNGNIIVDQDFSMGYNAGFTNYGFLSIGRDFYNGYSGLFQTNCMVSINGSWYNSATCSRLLNISCGGFDIADTSYNGGTVDSLDLCDAGHPVGGIDGNSGTLNGVTFCSCTNACRVVSSIQDVKQNTNFSLYPNPASDEIHLHFDNGWKDGAAIIYNMWGREMKRIPVIGSDTTLNISLFNRGCYLFYYSSHDGAIVSREKFIVE